MVDDVIVTRINQIRSLDPNFYQVKSVIPSEQTLGFITSILSQVHDKCPGWILDPGTDGELDLSWGTQFGCCFVADEVEIWIPTEISGTAFHLPNGIQDLVAKIRQFVH